MELPENWNQLTKHERKEFKRDYNHKQQLLQGKNVQLKKYGTIVLMVLFIVGIGYWSIREASKPQPGEYIISLGNKHLEKLSDDHEQYNSLPPTSGSHLGGKAPWGVSNEPIPDELQLHNLEDGGVVIQYNCLAGENTQNTATPSAQKQDECTTLIANLESIAKRYPDKVLMAPYPKLDTKIALTAWTRIDKFNELDTERIRKFIKAFKGIDHHK